MSTEERLKGIGLAFFMYANGSADNRWPGLALNERIWAPELSGLFPQWLSNSDLLIAREHPDGRHIRASLRAVLEGPNPDYDTAAGLMALSFAYLGYAVTNETEFSAVLHARTIGEIDGPGKAIPISGNENSVGPLRTMITMGCFGPVLYPSDLPPIINSALSPALVETWCWEQLRDTGKFRGAHVLYLDGHVAWVPLGTFPVVPSVMDGLCGILKQG